MNICIVSREYPPETGWGGIGTYTYHLAQGLARRGHAVHVVAQYISDADELGRGRGPYYDGEVLVHRVEHTTFLRKRGVLMSLPCDGNTECMCIRK